MSKFYFRFSLKADLPFPPAFRLNRFLPYLVRPYIRLTRQDLFLLILGLSGKREIKLMPYISICEASA